MNGIDGTGVEHPGDDDTDSRPFVEKQRARREALLRMQSAIAARVWREFAVACNECSRSMALLGQALPEEVEFVPVYVVDPHR